MNKTFTRLALAISAGALLTGGVATQANAAASDAVLKNASGSDRTISICKDWSGTKSDPDCKSGSARGTLAPGQNSKSKYGWKDTDGYYVPSGCRDNYGNRGGKWVKLSGFYGQTKTRLIDC